MAHTILKRYMKNYLPKLCSTWISLYVMKAMKPFPEYTFCILYKVQKWPRVMDPRVKKNLDYPFKEKGKRSKEKI